MSDRVKRPQLGRGLSALFGEGGARVLAGPGAPRTVPIEAIRPSPFQPRRRFAEAELDGLVQSIREKGIVQPLLVRPVDDLVDNVVADSADPGAEFELVAGERRWRAAQRAGLHEVPVVIRPFGDSEVLEIALVENLQREDLTPLEEADAYSRLMRSSAAARPNSRKPSARAAAMSPIRCGCWHYRPRSSTSSKKAR
jgi:ParB family chromosome partitioning protein